MVDYAHIFKPGTHRPGRILVEELVGLHDGYWIVRAALQCGDQTVRADFFTDFGSVPRPFWWWVSPTDATLAVAFLVHDGRYEDHAVSRRGADRLLYEIAVAQGTSCAKAWCIWLGVRLGGARSYRTGPERQRARLTEYQRWQRR